MYMVKSQKVIFWFSSGSLNVIAGLVVGILAELEAGSHIHVTKTKG